MATPIRSNPFLLFYFLILVHSGSAQSYHRADTIPVKENTWLKMPWTGGINYAQFSSIDINLDGIKDLFIFDRTGHKVTTFINGGTPNTVDYYDSTIQYAPKFPRLEDWALLRDFNMDGKVDIFTYGITVGGIRVWKNTSSGGNLQFTEEKPYLESNYGSSVSNLYVTRVDIPTIDDIDGDGDLDILTMNFSNTLFEYHVNQSVQMGYGSDSLIFIMAPGCWGNFSEPFVGCGVNINVTCRTRTDNPNHPFYPPFTREEEYRHALESDGGNCSLCLDMDADGDKDAVLGQLCCNMTMLTNGGTPSSANMIAKDTSFPSNNIPVGMNALPCGYFVDVNNDNKRDLIVAPNMPNISIDNESVWFYENTGADNAPVFARRKRSLFQEEMIDMGSGSNPALFDFDNDGLTDLLVSNYSMMYDTCMPTTARSYNVRAYKNTGTIASPKFELTSTDYAGLSTQLPDLPGKHLTFGDLDGDLAKDMIVGDYNGYVHYFKNMGGTGTASFVLTTANLTDNTANPINIGMYATPQLIDLDRDGDLDLIIGKRSGTISYYENIGTTSVASFKLITSKLGNVKMLPGCCTGYSVPLMYDSAGSYRLLVGSEASKTFTPPMGWVRYYKDIDGNLGGNFTLVDSMYQNIWEGERMTISGKDMNNDGKLDLVIGNFRGGLGFYISDSTSTGIAELDKNTFDFSIYPNPSSGEFTVSLPGKINSGSAQVYNKLGEKVFEVALSRKQETIRPDLQNGIYFCSVTAGQYTLTKKFVIIK